MRRLFALLALASLGLPRASRADEFRLSWDHCFGDRNVYAKTFACNTNVGSELLVASYVADPGLPAVRSFNAVVDIKNAAGPLPSWWQLNSAGCRPTGLGASFTPPAGSSACRAWAPGVGGGITSYLTPLTSPTSPYPNTARVLLTIGTATATAFPAGQETFLFSITIPHNRTAGTGACTGCDAPMCVTLSSLTMKLSDLVTSVYLPSSNTQSWAATVTWQSAHRGETTRSCNGLLHTCYFEAACDLPTPNHRDTWGTLKSMYR